MHLSVFQPFPTIFLVCSSSSFVKSTPVPVLSLRETLYGQCRLFIMAQLVVGHRWSRNIKPKLCPDRVYTLDLQRANHALDTWRLSKLGLEIGWTTQVVAYTDNVFVHCRLCSSY